jgi:hypothetical protein
MQRIFLHNDPSRFCLAFRDQDEEMGWTFSIPGGPGEASAEDAVGYLVSLRRYPTRQQFTIHDLSTFEMRHGEFVQVPWGEFLVTEDQWLQDLLEAYKCFCCAEGFSGTVPLDEVDAEMGNVLVASPCDRSDHAVCVECLRRIVLNFYSHPVTKPHPYIGCLFDDCGSTRRHAMASFQRILTPDEYDQLYLHVARMRTPDLLTLSCAQCQTSVSVEFHSRLQNRHPISIGCGDCFFATCWHCMNPEIFCMCFRIHSESMYGGFFNRYVRPPPGQPLYRNFELDLAALSPTIDFIFQGYVDGEDMIPACTKCGAHIAKTILCNEMMHCATKWCHCCGFQSLQTETVLMDHYGQGEQECPRYESIEYWHAQGAHLYQCEEGVCFGDHSDCTIEPHAAGRAQKHQARRRNWLKQVLSHIPRRLRLDTILFCENTYPNHPLLNQAQAFGRPVTLLSIPFLPSVHPPSSSSSPPPPPSSSPVV